MVTRDSSLKKIIIENCLRDIHSQKFLPGDKMPSSSELAKHYGVNGHIIREVLSYLQAEGVIDVRRGRNGGIFVADNTMERFTCRMASLIQLHDISSKDVCELRVYLELKGCETSFHCITDEFILKQEQLNEKILVETDIKTHMDMNEDFHVSMAEYGNKLIGILLHPMYQFLNSRVAFFNPKDLRVYHKPEEHQVILEALKKRDLEKFLFETEKHIRNAYERFSSFEREELEKQLPNLCTPIFK